MREAIRGHQSSSELVDGALHLHAMREAIRGHQSSSELVDGALHLHAMREAIRGHQRSLELVDGALHLHACQCRGHRTQLGALIMTEVIRDHRTQLGALSGRSSWIALGRRQSSAIKRNQGHSGALSGSRLVAPQSSAIKAQSSRNQVAIKRNPVAIKRTLAASRASSCISSTLVTHLMREAIRCTHTPSAALTLVHRGDAQQRALARGIDLARELQAAARREVDHGADLMKEAIRPN